MPKVTLEEVLLPSNVSPIRYALTLEPDLVRCDFKGSESVHIEIHRPTASLKLHAHQLSIDADSVHLHPDGGAPEIPLKGISYDLAMQTVELTFASPIPTGKATLRCTFGGKLSDDLAGFYRSKYTLHGVSRYMAVTQFEATDARRAFPCFDEPAQKAVFGVTITAAAEETVLSNGIVTRCETSPDGRTRTWTFADTPKMASYLVAFVVGHFDCVSAMGKTGVRTTVYTPVGKSALGAFALKVGVAGLELFEQLFGIPYFGGPKCDHIAIADFAAGAMENTGCITYREAALLIDEKESSLAMKQRVAQVVCHELSHQWFGNLATMQWWSQLWLNEGFAKWCEYAATSRLFPEWNTFSHFTSMVQATAFRLDSLASTHPIEVPVAHPDEVNEVFDSISYNKGASVIRMMFDWLTTEVGLKGIHAYLSRFAHSNAVTTDLWAALQEASGLPVGDVMRNWTLLPGHPFVAVSSSQAADGGALARGSLKLSSKRFTAPWAASSTAWPAAADFPGGAGHAGFEAACAAHGGAGSAEACDDWNIPISVVTGSAGASGGAGGAAAAAAVGTARKLGVLMLDDPKKRQSREATLAATAEAIAAAAAEGGAGWVKLNADHAAFFRTVYDGALLARLHAAVRTPADGAGEPALGINDRLGLVGDVGAAVSIGLTPAADLLPLLWEMRHEREYTVWVSMTDALAAVQAAADGVSKELGSQVTAFTRALLQPVVERVGWEADPAEQPNVALLRALVLRAAAIADNETVVAEALRRFDAYAAGGAPISADLKQLVYNTAAASGGAARWHAIHKLFGAAGSSEEQRRLMTALGRASDPALLQRTLGMLLSEEIRSQDAPFVLDAVASNPGSAGRDAAWGLLTGQWDAMSKRFGGGNFLWQSLVGSACGSFDTREKATEVEAWFADPAHPSGSAERTIRQKLEAIRNRAWRRHLLSREAEALPAVLRRLSGGAK